MFSTTSSAEQGQIYALTFLGLPNWLTCVMYGLATKKQQPTLSLFVAPNLNTSKQACLLIFHGVEVASCSDFPDSETGTNKL